MQTEIMTERVPRAAVQFPSLSFVPQDVFGVALALPWHGQNNSVVIVFLLGSLFGKRRSRRHILFFFHTIMSYHQT